MTNGPDGLGMRAFHTTATGLCIDENIYMRVDVCIYIYTCIHMDIYTYIYRSHRRLNLDT
jgi:hypothetical protein